MERMLKTANVEQAIEALLDPVVNSWMKDHGFVRGDFHGDRNLLDQIKDQDYRQQLDEALRGSAQADRQGYERLMQGFANLTGTKWTPELQQKARTLSGDFAQVAPYLYRAAPDLFDELHGSEGSVASLTHAIADANKGRMDPREAGKAAQTIFQQLYDGDPVKTRGFSARQMGQIYQQMARRGMIGPGETPQNIARTLERYAGPVSAIRDTLGYQGWPVGVGDMFHVMDQLAPGEMAQFSPHELETRLRTGDALGRMGGLYSAATKFTPAPTTPGVAPLATVAAQDLQLRRQAAQSRLGNLAATTHRLDKASPFEEGTPAFSLMRSIEQGDMPITEPGAWLDAMEQSGIPRETAQQMLSQDAVNLDEMTPDLVDTIRRNQLQTDLNPYLDQMTPDVSPEDPRGAGLQQGAREEIARGLGYNSLAHMQQLHEPAQHTRSIMDQAREQAQVAQDVSHLGQQSFPRRMVDAVQQATPQTNWQELGERAFNMLPRNQVPQNAQQHFSDLFNPGAGRPPAGSGAPAGTPDAGVLRVGNGGLRPAALGGGGGLQTKAGTDDYWTSPLNKDGRKCPGCGELFKECEPLPDVKMCEVCERYGPPKSAAAYTTADTEALHALACFFKLAAATPTVAVDLDGTLAKMYDKFDPKKIEDPRPGAKTTMEKFRAAGWRIIIFTVRGDDKLTAEWLKKHDIPYDFINKNPDQPAGASGKVIADLYIDDRALDARQAWKRLGELAVRRMRAA